MTLVAQVLEPSDVANVVRIGRMTVFQVMFAIVVIGERKAGLTAQKADRLSLNPEESLEFAFQEQGFSV
jgi:hypothetical protein